MVRHALQNFLVPSPVRLPSLLTGFSLIHDGSPRETARVLASEGLLGAGDAIVGTTPGEAVIAIVLEPEVAGSVARQMGPLTMVAGVEALGALLPPKVAIEHLWPGDVIVNGGLAGHVSLAMPPSANERPPAWLVVDVRLDLHGSGGTHEPGERPATTCLAEEGGATLAAPDVVHALATRFLSWLDRWQADGFAPVAHDWLFRARGRTQDIDLPLLQPGSRGRVLRLMNDCSLVVRTIDGDEHILDWPSDTLLAGEAVAP